MDDSFDNLRRERARLLSVLKQRPAHIRWVTLLKYLLAAVIAILTLFPGILDDFGLHFLTVFVRGVALVLAVLAGSFHYEAKVGPVAKWWWPIYFVFTAAIVLIFGVSSCRIFTAKPQLPRFTLSVRDGSTSSESRLNLTNKSIFASIGRVEIAPSNGVLVVSMLPGQTNVELVFGVKNGPLKLESGLVAFWVPKRLGLSSTDGWRTTEPHTSGMHGVGFTLPNTILPNDGLELPSLILTPNQSDIAGSLNPGTNTQFPVSILLKANEMPPENLAFLMVLIRLVEPQPAKLVFGTKSPILTNGFQLDIPRVYPTFETN